MKKTILGALLGTVLALHPQSASAQSEIYPQHFDLEEVTLLDGPFKTALDLNIDYLLRYDVDRLLTPFVRQSGLAATTDRKSPYYQWEKKHPNHDNWGSGGFRLDGHVGGHYMSALALAYAATHDAVTKEKIMKVIDHMLPILKDCQDAFDGTSNGMEGFLGGQPCNDAWISTAAGKVGDFGPSAVPLYCQHKILAGLRDMYLYLDGEQAEASKAMFKRLCDWHINLVSKLTDDQLQGWLGTEHGGVNETLADAYRIFGEKKYLTAAKRYSHQWMMNNMQSLNTTFLDGHHANTQVPKFVGFARIAQEDASASTYKTAAKNFWQDVANNRTVNIGGNSVNEHFISKTAGNRYMDETNGPESCNTNNMLKLSEDLFDIYHDGKYADFYEAATYNHILSTQDPVTGGYVYFTPLRPQSYRIYSVPDQDMWCCVGTGMENHSKYGHFIYTHNNGTLYVNLFTASRLENETFALTQETKFPYEQATKITIDKDGNYKVAIRKPAWVSDGYKITINGAEATYSTRLSYAILEKQDWKQGDVIEVSLPMSLRYEQCPNLKDYIAFKYGPILLAARTSPDGEELPHEYAKGERMGHAPDSYAPKKPLSSMPMLIGERKEVLGLITPQDEPLHFTLNAARPQSPNYGWKNLTLEPWFSLHHCRVSNYFYQATEQTYLNSSWAQEEALAKLMEDRTIDRIDIGQQQAEAGCVTHSANSSSGTYNDEDYRDTQANGWIEAVLNNPDPDAKALAIVLRYTTADKNRKCKIYVNGTLLRDYTVPGEVRHGSNTGFYNLEIPLGDLAFDSDGKALPQFTVRIVASASTPNPGLYYMRLTKDYAPVEPPYVFQAADWGFTGDGGRVSQDKIQVDTEENTITLTQSGTNNICLKYGGSTEYEVAGDQKYLVVRGTNLSRANGSAYLWWLNGANHGSSVAPKATALKDGRTQLAWDIPACGITDNTGTDPWYLTTAYNANSTIFGLTAQTASKPVVITYIGFMTEAQLKGTGDPDALTSQNFSQSSPTYYSLNGTPLSSPQRGINIRRDANGQTQKVMH